MKRSIPSVVPAQHGVTVSRDFSINGFGDSIDLSSNSMDFSSNSMDFSSGSIDFSSGSIDLSFSEMSSCRTISSSSGSRPLLERAGRKPAKKKGIASMSRVSSASIARAAQPFGRGQDYQYDFNDDLSFLGMTPSRDDQYEYVWKRPRYDDNRQRSHNETIAVPNALSEASRSAIETEDRARVLAATIYPIPEEQKARMDQAFGGHISVRSAKGFMGYLSEGAKGVVMSISNAAIVSPSRAAPKTVPEVVLAEPLRKPISETSMSTHPYQTSEGTLVVAYGTVPHVQTSSSAQLTALQHMHGLILPIW